MTKLRVGEVWCNRDKNDPCKVFLLLDLQGSDGGCCLGLVWRQPNQMPRMSVAFNLQTRVERHGWVRVT